MTEKYIDHAADALAREIDDSILSNLLEESGWIKVTMLFTSRYQAVDTEEWVRENCTGKWRRYNSAFLFEKSVDAEWFILKHKQ